MRLEESHGPWRNGGPLRLVELRGEADQRKSAVELCLDWNFKGLGANKSG